jgi:hypothetical protein
VIIQLTSLTIALLSFLFGNSAIGPKRATWREVTCLKAQ